MGSHLRHSSEEGIFTKILEKHSGGWASCPIRSRYALIFQQSRITVAGRRSGHVVFAAARENSRQEPSLPQNLAVKPMRRARLKPGEMLLLPSALM